MPATVTLSSTSLKQTVDASQRSVRVESTSGLYAGLWLFCDGELMSIVSLGVGSDVNVRRGVGATLAMPHNFGSTIYIGRPDQFYSSDPVGKPGEAIPVSPYINVKNGSVWFAVGAGDQRRWEKQVATYSAGALGVQVTTYSPSSST